jgi:hypothetical protein
MGCKKRLNVEMLEGANISPRAGGGAGSNNLLGTISCDKIQLKPLERDSFAGRCMITPNWITAYDELLMVIGVGNKSCEALLMSSMK